MKRMPNSTVVLGSRTLGTLNAQSVAAKPERYGVDGVDRGYSILKEPR